MCLNLSSSLLFPCTPCGLGFIPALHCCPPAGQLPGKVRNALMLDATMRQLAEQLKDEHSLMFFARGRNYATALEAALKAKEVALIHSEGILAGEMKHGPLALVDEHLPIIVVATKDSMHKKMDSVIQQLLARAAKLFIVCNEGDEGMKAYEQQGCQLIKVKGLPGRGRGEEQCGMHSG